MFGVNQKRILAWMTLAGVEARPVGSRGRQDVDTELIVELRDTDQLSWRQIADSVGMSKTSVINRYRVATEGNRRDRQGIPFPVA